jgi:hypothetical protein
MTSLQSCHPPWQAWLEAVACTQQLPRGQAPALLLLLLLLLLLQWEHILPERQRHI